MTIFLHTAGISYYAVPKCASSSLKQLFFQIENGFEYRKFVANGRHVHIHNIYPTLAFDRSAPRDRVGTDRIAVIRDPVDRLLSAYAHRIGKRGGLPLTSAASAAGVDPEPFLASFIDRLEEYREHSPWLAHHTELLVHFLGQDAAYFTALYPLADLHRLVSGLSARLQRELTIDRVHTDGPKLNRSVLTRAQVRRIEEFYAKDYEVFGAHFGV